MIKTLGESQTHNKITLAVLIMILSAIGEDDIIRGQEESNNRPIDQGSVLFKR